MSWIAKCERRNWRGNTRQRRSRVWRRAVREGRFVYYQGGRVFILRHCVLKSTWNPIVNDDTTDQIIAAIRDATLRLVR